MSDYQIKKNYSVGDKVVFRISKRCTRAFHGEIIKINEKSYRVKGYDYQTKKIELVTIPKPFVTGIPK